MKEFDVLGGSAKKHFAPPEPGTGARGYLFQSSLELLVDPDLP
jgi:hypothetical protein